MQSPGEQILDLKEKDDVELYLGRIETGDPHKFLEAQEKKKGRSKKKAREKKRTRGKKKEFKEPKIGTEIDNAKLIFRGKLSKLVKKFKFTEEIVSTLAKLFDKRHITTNEVESRFAIKSSIRRHKATRESGRILKGIMNYYNAQKTMKPICIFVSPRWRPPIQPSRQLP